MLFENLKNWGNKMQYAMHDFVMLNITTTNGDTVTLFGNADAANKMQNNGYYVTDCDTEDENKYIDDFLKFKKQVEYVDEYVGQNGCWGGVHLATKK